jgi:hypothetical protein
MKKLIGGSLLIFFGLFMLLGFFASESPATFMVNLLMLVLMVFAPIVTGALIIRLHYAKKKHAELQSRKSILASREKEIWRLAKQKGGELTISEIVAETSMNADEADEILRELVVKRHADMKLTNDGTVIYEFFDLLKERRNERMVHSEPWVDDRDVN